MKSVFSLSFVLFIFACTSEPVVKLPEIQEVPVIIEEDIQEKTDIHSFIPTAPFYVIYHDTRREEAYLSIAYIDSDIYLVNRKIIETGERVSFTISIQINNGIPEPRNIEIISGKMDNIHTADIISDILNMIKQRHRTPVDDITKRITLTDKLPGYTLIHSYNKWIPLFNLYSTDLENENRLRIIKIGALKDDKDNNFFDFKLPDEFNDTPDYEIDNYFNNLRNINNLVLIRLDEYWIQNENNIYVIADKTLTDALIFAEEIDLDDLNLNTIDDFIKQSLCYKENYIDTKSISVDIFNNYLTLSYNAYDTQAKNYKKVFNVFIPGANKRVYIIVTLNTFLSLYNNNKQYFDKILF